MYNKTGASDSVIEGFTRDNNTKKSSTMSDSESLGNEEYECQNCGDVCSAEDIYSPECCEVELCGDCYSQLTSDVYSCCDSGCNKQQFDKGDTFCYVCVMKEPFRWCRNKDCDTIFNPLKFWPLIVSNKEARDISPGATLTWKKRRSAFNSVARAIDGKSMSDFTIAKIKAFIYRIEYDRFARSDMQKADLWNVLTESLNNEMNCLQRINVI